VARTTGWILAFTAGGQCHFLPVVELPESGRASRGQSVYSLMHSSDRGDRIVAMQPVEELDDETRLVVFLSRGGLVKRTPLGEFSTARSTGLIAAGVRDGDEIMDVVLSDGSAELMLLTRQGRAIRFPEDEVPVQGRTAQGVKGIDLRGDDQVIGLVLVRRDAAVLTVTEDGAGKRTPVSEFPLQKRGGLGTLASPSSGKASPVVAALEVVEDDEVMVVTGAGKVTSVGAAEVPVQGRRTQGRRLVTVAKGDRVVEVTRSAGGSPEHRAGSSSEASAPGVDDRGGRDVPDGDGDGEDEGQLDLLGD
jgi:DNA gyrase subunit A